MMASERVYPRDYESPPVSGEHNTKDLSHGNGGHHRLLSQDSLMSKDSYAYNSSSGPPSGTYVVQVPKDQIYRIPPPENAYKFKRYTKRKPRRSCCCRCLCITISVLFLVAALLALSTGIFYLIYRPKAPTFSIQKASVAGVNATAPGSSNTNPVFNFTVRAANPNRKIGIHYLKGSSLEVFHADERLGGGELPEFYAPGGNVKVFAVLVRGGEIVLSGSTRKTMASEEKKGQVPLEVDADVRVRIKIGKVNTWKFTAKVKCTVVLSALSEKAKLVENHCKFSVKPW